jgi:hypothetical protein
MIFFHQRLSHKTATSVAMTILDEVYPDLADERDRMDTLIYFNQKIQGAIGLYVQGLQVITGATEPGGDIGANYEHPSIDSQRDTSGTGAQERGDSGGSGATTDGDQRSPEQGD